MKKLASWFGIIIFAWLLGFFYNVYNGGSLAWLRRMYLQKMALAAEVKETPRLLITGGSGAHYTLNSDIISQGLNISVLNLGLDGPVGLNVILASVLKQVKSGDIVLLIPEYQILLDEDGFGDRSIPLTLSLGEPNLGNMLQENDPKVILENLLMLGEPTLKSLTKSGLDLITKGELTGYYSAPLTPKGDATEVFYRQSDWWPMTFEQPVSNHAIKTISEFKNEVEKKGGKLIISLPWVYAKSDQETLKNVEKTAQELAKIAPLIYDPQNLNLQNSPELFADTQYHLLPKGRNIRSQQLVEQLREIINKNK